MEPTNSYFATELRRIADAIESAPVEMKMDIQFSYHFAPSLEAAEAFVDLADGRKMQVVSNGNGSWISSPHAPIRYVMWPLGWSVGVQIKGVDGVIEYVH